MKVTYPKISRAITELMFDGCLPGPSGRVLRDYFKALQANKVPAWAAVKQSLDMRMAGAESLADRVGYQEFD